MIYPTLLDYQVDCGYIFAFSTTRKGGVSQGNYGGFNMNPYCGDNPEHVEANRNAFFSRFIMMEDGLIMPHQVHGTEVRKIDKAYFDMSAKEKEQYLDGVDALMTDLSCLSTDAPIDDSMPEPRLCIGVSTADCIPVLLIDELHVAASAVHAGWRGTVKGIVQKTLAAMQEEYGTRPEDVEAIIGPGISMKNFEVGDEVYEAFVQAGFDMAGMSCKVGGKWHIDLWEANSRQLCDMGVAREKIMVAGICTYDHVEDFFSARRLGIASGRIFTGVMIVG
jgi:YfiH family protein